MRRRTSEDVENRRRRKHNNWLTWILHLHKLGIRRPKPKDCNVSGDRVFVFGATVNQVKKAVGKLAKKVRVSGNGNVEVIHTLHGNNTYKIREALKGFETNGWDQPIDEETRRNFYRMRSGHYKC